jgi:opacity protein-like surface antigen
MMCTRLKLSFLIAMIPLAAGAARAADYAPPPQCYDAGFIASGRAPYGAVPCYVPPPPVVEEFSSWYLRGDIGFSNQQVKRLTNPIATPPMIASSYGFDAAPTFGLGIGYYFNDWLRFDVTGEYRSRANFHGSEIYNVGGVNATDEYSGSKSEWLALLNGYVDLGTWNRLTPFVGAGIGVSRNTIHNFQDVCHGCGGNPANNGVSFAGDTSKWNFAWALHAGVSYKVTNNFMIEFSYRYLDMGKAETGQIVSYDFSQSLPGSTFDRLTSHDFRLGLRFNFDALEQRSTSYYAPPPVYQPPVYQQPAYPPPVYVQPPLRSKG